MLAYVRETMEEHNLLIMVVASSTEAETGKIKELV